MATDTRRLRLLEIKRAAKLASDAEIAVLRDAYTTVGDGLAVPLTLLSSREWEAKYGGERLTLFMDRMYNATPAFVEEKPRYSEPTRTSDGLILCAPEAEPPPVGKEHTFRANVLGRD